MRILCPGQKVVLNESDDGTRIEGSIVSVQIYADHSVVYNVCWWCDRVTYSQAFDPTRIIEPHDAQYFELSQESVT